MFPWTKPKNDEINSEEAESHVIKMPSVALRGMTILPGTVIHFDISRQMSIQAVEKAMSDNQRLFLVTQTDPDVKDPDDSTVYEYGTVAYIKQVFKLPGEVVRVLVEGIERAHFKGFDSEITDYLLANIILCNDEAVKNDASYDGTSEDVKYAAMKREILDALDEYKKVAPKLAHTPKGHYETITDFSKLLDDITSNIPIPYDKKQKVLSCVDVSERSQVLLSIILDEIEIERVRKELATNLKERVDKNQKEYLLREQMNYIRGELGDSADTDSDAEKYLDDLVKLEASDEIKDRIQKEIKRFRSLSSSSSESSVSRGYIETLLELPWDKMEDENRDLKNAEEVLDRDHYGLAKVKERMLEFLAVRNLTNKGDSPIICLVGPPGTGKTSIAKSVAAALEKKYVRICLGGVSDEAEIRGHRRTYIGAMPGRIIEGLREAKVKNPLMLLDEIDKAGTDRRGDTASALLEVLDSEQNSHFKDHYVDLPVDLSEVLFIATANDPSMIPRPLYDRMEIVEISGYTMNEKMHIAKDYLVAKQMEKNGLKDYQLLISDAAIEGIIQSYTREAGVRSLERRIGEICRKCARKIYSATEDIQYPIEVTDKNLVQYLGSAKYIKDSATKADEVGIVRGLAWTAVGGTTLEIEVNILPGKGELKLTGKLGDVMKESAMAGLTYVRSIADRYGIGGDYFAEHDIHVHIPEGATPKDGPSAGITMATAILSAVTGIPVKWDYAMTGEITLRGRVLPIGGLKEKLLAAKTVGMKNVIVPIENEKDVNEIDEEIIEGINIIYASTMDTVLENALSDKKAAIKNDSSRKSSKKSGKKK